MKFVQYCVTFVVGTYLWVVIFIAYCTDVWSADESEKFDSAHNRMWQADPLLRSLTFALVECEINYGTVLFLS